jgi:rubredoxin
MPQIKSHDEVKANRKQREVPGGYAWRTDFRRPPEGVKHGPMAFLAEGSPGRVIKPHFHDVDQFQVIVSGGGALGKHGLKIHAVHFSRAHTPYGPLVASQEGLGFLTLRAHWDPGAQYLPDSREKLKSAHGRRPWQMTELPQFEGAGEVNLHAFSKIRNEEGLAVWSLSLKPNVQSAAPDCAASNGQYIIVTKGSLTYQDKEYGAISIAFVEPDEGAFPLLAGAQGVEALVLNYPRQSAGIVAQQPVAATPAVDYRVWQCALCAFTYDEAKGMPDEGIAPGTRWEDVPETWTCPDCSASKDDFQMSVIG